MNITGIGTVFTRGRGINNFEAALIKGWVPPRQQSYSLLPDKSLPVYTVNKEDLVDKKLLKKTRRADKFSKMAVLAASDALTDSGLDADKIESTGIIVSTAFGPHATTFRFLDDIIDYGDRGVSPTLFSNSVHNAAASYIASALNIHGPTLTLTQFKSSFHQALILAGLWIKQQRCDNVLVGSVDECGDVMKYICAERLKIAGDGKISPFRFSSVTQAVPGEGAVFFLVSKQVQPEQYCKISSVITGNNLIDENKPDMYILDSDGMGGDETDYLQFVGSGIMVTGYAPIFGSMMAGSAFNCAAGALMLKNRIKYRCPVQDNPHAVNLCLKTEPADIDYIRCIKNNCSGESAAVSLRWAEV